jgi:hypothetical protein
MLALFLYIYIAETLRHEAYWMEQRPIEKSSLGAITILDIIHLPVIYLETRRFGDYVSVCSGGIHSFGPNR